MIIEHTFLQALEEKNCAVVREILAHHPISLTVWQNALDHFSLVDDKQMLCALVEHIDVNSMSQDTAVLCVSHRIDSIVDQIVRNARLNEVVRRQLCFVITLDRHFPVTTTANDAKPSCHEESLAYMDQRMCAVQKYAIKQHLGEHRSGAQPKRL